MPMHYANVSTNYAEYPWNQEGSRVPPPLAYKDMPVQPLGNRQAFYDEMIQGCVKYYGTKGYRCLEYEADRIEMTLRQPQSMENYTEMGFKKIRAPENVWKLIKEFWDRNKNDQSNENWPTGNTYSKLLEIYFVVYVSHWVACDLDRVKDLTNLLCAVLLLTSQPLDSSNSYCQYREC